MNIRLIRKNKIKIINQTIYNFLKMERFSTVKISIEKLNRNVVEYYDNDLQIIHRYIVDLVINNNIIFYEKLINFSYSIDCRMSTYAMSLFPRKEYKDLLKNSKDTKCFLLFLENININKYTIDFLFRYDEFDFYQRVIAIKNETDMFNSNQLLFLISFCSFHQTKKFLEYFEEVCSRTNFTDEYSK